MNIRSADIGDAKKIHEMINKMYGELEYGISFDEEFVLSRIKSRFFIVKVAEENHEIIGFSIVQISKNDYAPTGNSMGFLYELYVEKPFRKKGYAKQLLLEMEQVLLDFGINYMELYVSVKNQNGMGFWQASGCTPKYTVLSKKLSAE